MIEREGVGWEVEFEDGNDIVSGCKGTNSMAIAGKRSALHLRSINTAVDLNSNRWLEML